MRSAACLPHAPTAHAACSLTPAACRPAIQWRHGGPLWAVWHSALPVWAVHQVSSNDGQGFKLAFAIACSCSHADALCFLMAWSMDPPCAMLYYVMARHAVNSHALLGPVMLPHCLSAAATPSPTRHAAAGVAATTQHCLRSWCPRSSGRPSLPSTARLRCAAFLCQSGCGEAQAACAAGVAARLQARLLPQRKTRLLPVAAGCRGRHGRSVSRPGG